MGCNVSTSTLTKQSTLNGHTNLQAASPTKGKTASIYTVHVEEDPQKEEGQVLTKRQKILILKSWKSLSSKQVQHARTIFLRIFEQNPNLKAMFPFNGLEGEALTSNPLFQAHSLRFIQIVQSATDSLDDLENQLTPIILNLGKFHRRKSTVFSAEYFQTFIDALLYVWSVELGSGFTDEVKGAWTAVMDFIVQWLKKGYGNDVS